MIKQSWKNIMGIGILGFATMKYYAPFFGFSGFTKYMMLLSLLMSTIMIVTSFRKYNLIHLLLLGIFGIQFLLSKNITMAYTYYLCLALFTVDFRFIMKWFIIINAILFSIFMITNVLGINPTEYLEGRNDFGFGNPNTAFISMFIIWSSFFYYIFYSEKKIDYILLISMIFLMYTQTMTRTGLLTAVMTLLAFFILKSVDVRKKYFKIFTTAFPVLMTLFSLVITLFFSENYLINKILSHRPVYWRAYLLHPSKGINLVGYPPIIRDILFTQRMPLDSGYIWSLYSLGIITFLILLFLICYTLYNLCKENKKDQIMLMVSILIYCFAESIMLDLTTNIGIVLIIYGISKMKVKSFETIILSRKKLKSGRFED